MRVRAADEKARGKFLTVQYIRARMAEGQSMRGAWQQLQAEQENGEHLEHRVVSYAMTSRWIAQANSIEANSGRPFSIDDARDKIKTGRKRTSMSGKVRLNFRDGMILKTHSSIAALIRESQDLARKRKEPVPGEAVFRRMASEMDLTELTIGQFGRGVAETETVPHSTPLAERSHEFWQLDATKSPVAIRLWDDKAREYRSAYPQMIFVVDVHSKAVLAARIVPPRIEEGNVVEGYNSADILGTFFQAAISELAPSEMEPFTGALPDKLGLDNIQMNGQTRKFAKSLGINVPPSSPYKPTVRAHVEALVSSMKSSQHSLKGHRWGFVPTDRITTPERQRRTRAGAQTGSNHPVRAPLLPKYLMSIEQLEGLLLRTVISYNDQRSRREEKTRATIFREGYRRGRTRSGIEAINNLVPHQLRVTKDGIEHKNTIYAAWRESPSDAGVEIKPLPVGKTYMCRQDPLGRALFIDSGPRLKILFPKDVFAARHPAHEVVLAKQEKLGKHQAVATRSRDRRLKAMVGPAALAESEAAAAEIAKLKPKKKAKKKSETKPRKSRRKEHGKDQLSLLPFLDQPNRQPNGSQATPAPNFILSTDFRRAQGLPDDRN